jgi:hypothetical protein
MTATPDRHDGESFRVSHHGCNIGYARSVAELERWIELTDLKETLGLAAWHRTLKPAVAGSWRGWYQTDWQPPIRQRTVRYGICEAGWLVRPTQGGQALRSR